MERRHFIKVAGLAAVGAFGIPICTEATESQAGWRWCKKCEGLWFSVGGDERKGKCPAGENHDTADSGSYVVIQNDENVPGQQGWRWCKKCEGLWFAGGGDERKGKCPAGKHHDATDSGNYVLVLNDENAQGQNEWRWCKKCEGLWFAGGEKREGKCPGGDVHSKDDSGNYTLVQE